MSDSTATAPTPDRPLVYEIRIEGRLGPQWRTWFGETTVAQPANGDTVLTCALADQAQLYAILRKVRDLSVPLLSVTRLIPPRMPAHSAAHTTISFVSPLQVELFVRDVHAARAFYTQILGFAATDARDSDYLLLSNGPVRLALNAAAILPPDHPVAFADGKRPGRGVEFVFRVDDVRAAYTHVQQAGWPISGELQRQPWGLEDFRVQDPDGYYLRLTEPL